LSFSAGFSEENEQGAAYEQELVSIMEETGSSLIGPNCIGVITTTYAGCFSTPVPKLAPQGVDLSPDQALQRLFIMETAVPNGLSFSMYSVSETQPRSELKMCWSTSIGHLTPENLVG
jgi:acetyltransferase